jgi:DNA (cytosine-5)-methyltransferase 1
MTQLVLSLFPGIGLLDMAFEEEGFCVVRGPDLLWGGDIKRFHPPAGRFDGVIGGPPCQAFSRLRHLVEHNGYKVAANLIPEFERVVGESVARWFLMENVPAAPEPSVPGYTRTSRTFNNRWTGAAQHRMRRFTFGSRDHVQLFDLAPEDALLESATWEPAVLASGGQRGEPVAIGGSGKRKVKAKHLGYKTRTYAAAAAAAQGLPTDFDLPPFTTAGKIKAIGNGVPLPMGRAVARAVKRALGLTVERSTTP